MKSEIKWDQTVLRLDGGNGLDDGGLSMGGCCEGAKGIISQLYTTPC